MRTRARSLAALVAVLVLAALVASASSPVGAHGSTSQPGRPSARPAVDHVVLVGFDGFDRRYLGRVPTPNLDALARRGAIGTTLGPAQSVTSPSFATLVTGAWPDRTGNVAYVLDRATGTFQGQTRQIEVPTIAEAVREQGGTVGSAQYFILQDHGVAYGDPEGLYTQPGGACSRRFDDAVAMIERRPVLSRGVAVTVPRTPTLLGVYCDTLDTIGHAEGTESALIDAGLVELDAQVGRLLDALRRAGIAERTAVVVTGDHGMTTYDRAFGAELVAELAAHGLRAQYLLSGLTLSPDADVALTSAAGAVNAYLVGDAEGDPAALEALRAAAAATEGTAAVLDRRVQRWLRMDPRVGDLVIEAAPGWSADGWVITPPNGRHGSTGEVAAALVVGRADVETGRGARPGGRRVLLRHVDVAPTIAHLLGIDPPSGSEGVARRDLVTGR